MVSSGGFEKGADSCFAVFYLVRPLVLLFHTGLLSPWGAHGFPVCTYMGILRRGCFEAAILQCGVVFEGSLFLRFDVSGAGRVCEALQMVVRRFALSG